MMLDQPIALATELGGDAVEENPYLLGIFAPVDERDHRRRRWR